MSPDPEKYGPWALVIGASDGVGEAFARKLAGLGFNLVIVARRIAALEALAADLESDAIEVRAASVDMTEPDAMEQVRRVTGDIEVGLLVYNAGTVGLPGPFIEQEPDQHLRYVQLNVLGHTQFSQHFGRLMCDRGKGGIILLGSTGSYMGSPGLAVYCATKAYIRVLSESLWMEFREHGVDVLGLILGFTATPTISNLGFDISSGQSPDEAAQEGLDNIANGPLWIAGGQQNIGVVKAKSVVEGRADAVLGSVIKLADE